LGASNAFKVVKHGAMCWNHGGDSFAKIEHGTATNCDDDFDLCRTAEFGCSIDIGAGWFTLPKYQSEVTPKMFQMRLYVIHLWNGAPAHQKNTLAHAGNRLSPGFGCSAPKPDLTSGQETERADAF
jgi:hypothetical protein